MEEVQDEEGNTLVKIVLVNDNNEHTGVAYVSREDADQIIAGTMTILSEVDEATGQTLVTLTPVEGAGQQEEGEETAGGQLHEAAGAQHVGPGGDEVKDFTGLDALSHVIDNNERLGGGAEHSLDNLVMAANAASAGERKEALENFNRGENQDEGSGAASGGRSSFGIDNQKSDRPPLWRPVILQADHVAAIVKASDLLCGSQGHKNLQPEPYSKKLGSETSYEEMLSLMDIQLEGETADRMDLLKKHAMLFRPAGPNSRALTLYEQAVNEAASNICRHQPALLFHKRELAIMSKQCIRLTGIEFPSSRHTYLPSSTPASAPTASSQLQQASTNLIRDSLTGGNRMQRPGSDVQHFGTAKDLVIRNQLTNNEISVAIASAVLQMANEIPHLSMKSREQCSLIENYVYTDAVKLSKIALEKLDNEMSYIRDVSTVYGRYPSGPRNPDMALSLYEIAVNEAAAWIVRSQPSYLTHTRKLAEFAQKAVKATGINFDKQTAVSSSTATHSTGEKWNSSIHRALGSSSAGGGSAGGSASNTDMMHFRLQGDLFNYSGAGDRGGGTGFGEHEEDFETEMPVGSGQFSRYSTARLEDINRSGVVVYSNDTDMLAHEASFSLSLQCEEDDIQLNEEEILRITGAKTLAKVKSLRVPCMGFTSINVDDLSRCVHLRELDISENGLRQFPRRLHLPRLRRLGLAGNRFHQLPLIEQFPQLVRLTLDDKYKQVLNPQMLAYFCPMLKYINGQYFGEMLTEFTLRIIHEAKGTVEPHIRSKWDSEFFERYHMASLRGDRIKILESLVKQLKDKNLLMDETIGKYKDLLLFRFTEDYIKSKMCDPEDEMLAGTTKSTGIKTVDAIAVDYSDPEDEGEEDQEEKDAENKIAGEAALFKSAEELLGSSSYWDTSYNQVLGEDGLVGPGSSITLAGGQIVGQGPPGSIGMGPGEIMTPQFQSMQEEVIAHQVNLGRWLRQGKSIVMSLVKPKGVSGRPIAEFLPGELRNKDYVKGYMASEIYKKAVKDTLGLKGTPKKRNSTGRPRKSDTMTQGMKQKRTLSELNELTTSPGQPGDSMMGGNIPGVTPGMPGARKRGRPTKAAQLAAQVASSGGGAGGVPGGGMTPGMDVGLVAGVPARPRKRRMQGSSSRSLRDLYANYLGYPSASSNQPIDYDPLHFIRCHARDNDASDNDTKVWRCLFEPNPTSPEETTHVVATCGGECVCLINCETGKVMKRFKHIDEEFYTIAWTTVEVEGGKRTNLLAAAGRLMEIRLLHPEQLVCYAEMKGHVEDISSMTFHQTQPTILFSGDSKASILVWDIGVPSVPDYKTRYQLLMRLRCPRLDVNPVLNLIFLPHYAYLVAGCEDGIFAWKITEFRSEKREREPDMELKIPSAKEVCFDGLAQLSDNAIVVKCVDEGELYVFDFASILERRKGLQRMVPIELRGHLTWQKTDEVYINVSVRQCLGSVLCGDNEGSIWIYDLDPYLDDLQASTRKKFHAQPIKILEWPECSVQGNRDEDQQLKESITSGFRNPVVNTVEMSSDGYYLAAVTDNNLVCIWRFSTVHQAPLINAKQTMVVRPNQGQSAVLSAHSNQADSTSIGHDVME